MAAPSPFLNAVFWSLLVFAVLNVDAQADYPCPDSGLIFPCVCHVDETKIDMDCSDVTSDKELHDAFNGPYYPFQDLRRLKILRKSTESRVPITYLTETTFGEISFINITISHTTLEGLAEDTFSKSQGTLKTMAITDNFIVSFPFHTLNLFTSLTDLRLFKNNIDRMSDIVSTSLEYLQVSYNPTLDLDDKAFEKAPNLKQLLINAIGMNHIPPNMFSTLSQLEYLDMNDNHIPHLIDDSLKFTSPNLLHVKIAYNDISKIDPNAIQVLSPGPLYFWMHYNKMTDIPEQPFKQVFDAILGESNEDLFVFDGNIIHCWCNIEWLVSNPQYMDILAKGTICDDETGGMPLHEVDVDFIQNQCHPSLLSNPFQYFKNLLQNIGII